MTLGIIGTGLIGASIGIRAREMGYCVAGFDLEKAAAREAARLGAIDRCVSRAQLLEAADTIVIAAHVGGTLAEIERMRCEPPRASMIMDVSSVKGAIVRAARGLRNFVATHPMAGRECSGPSAAKRDLFDGKTWFYVPTGDAQLDRHAAQFIGALGSRPVAIDADAHDRAVALTSHVPQILANAFAARLPEESTALGPAARELLRLSRSGQAMWRDILHANSANICKELRALAVDLERAAQTLAHAP